MQVERLTLCVGTKKTEFDGETPRLRGILDGDGPMFVGRCIYIVARRRCFVVTIVVVVICIVIVIVSCIVVLDVRLLCRTFWSADGLSRVDTLEGLASAYDRIMFASLVGVGTA